MTTDETPKASSMTAKKPVKRRLLYMTSGNGQKENEDIEQFLSRDINSYDMQLMRKNQKRYQDYLSKFRGSVRKEKKELDEELEEWIQQMETKIREQGGLRYQEMEKYMELIKVRKLKEMVQMNLTKNQVKEKKWKKETQQKAGFEESYLPQENNGMMRARFGKLVKSNAAFEALRQENTRFDKRSISVPR